MGQMVEYVSKTNKFIFWTVCLHDNLAFCWKEIGRVGVTQEFSIYKTFFVVNFVWGVSFHFTINKLTLTDPHCAEPFIAQERKKTLSEMSLGLLWKVWCLSSKEALYLHVYCTEPGYSQTPAAGWMRGFFWAQHILLASISSVTFFLPLSEKWEVSIYGRMIQL